MAMLGGWSVGRGAVSRTAGALALAAVMTGAARAGSDAPAPGAPAGPQRVVEHQGFKVTLDLGPQKLAVSMPQDTSFEPEAGTLVHARIRDASPHAGMLSASVLAMKAKQFDDGLYAAVDLAAQEGAGTLGGKKALLEALSAALEREEPSPAVAVVLAANGLRDRAVVAHDSRHAPEVRRVLEEFEKHAHISKPIGFYTWSPELRGIFRQDRMLQQELKGGAGIRAIGGALRSDSKLRASYEGYLDLVARLTNPLVPENPDLRALIADEKAPVPEAGTYFFPPSRAHETELVKRLYGDRPIPEGFSLVDALAKAVRERSISLEPTEASGWYDHQCWSLETLIAPERAPEAAKLLLDAEYKKHLYELYKGILALTRETHIKQLEVPAVGAEAPHDEVEIEVRPDLAAEPLATFYRRRALSYAFVRGVLASAFGNEGLAKMRRMTAEGPVGGPLGDEILRMERLFRGAAIAVEEGLGVEGGEAEHIMAAAWEGAFRAFRDGLASDPDVGRDARMMVPLFYDLGREKTKVLAFLGWRMRPVRLSYAERPKVLSVTGPDGKPAGGDKVKVGFETTYDQVVYPVTVEVYVKKILSREEMRALCDAKKTKEAIVKALEE